MTNLTGPNTLDKRVWSVDDPDVYVAKIRGTRVRYRRKSTGAYLSGWILPLGPLPRPVATTALGGVVRSLQHFNNAMAFAGKQALKPLSEAVERMNNALEYDAMTRDQLRAVCKERGLKGYGNLRKGELVTFLLLNDKRVEQNA